MELPGESRLIDGILVGEPEAAEAFVRDFEPRIRRAVLEAGIPSADEPDVTQDIVIEVVRQIAAGQFEKRATLRTWVRRIVHGRTIDYWRRTGRRERGRAVSLDSVSDSSFLSSPTQEARLIAHQETRLVAEKALDALSVRERLALVARFRDHVEVSDLARLLGLSVKRTQNILTEAKTKFRAAIGAVEKPRRSRRLKDKE